MRYTSSAVSLRSWIHASVTHVIFHPLQPKAPYDKEPFVKVLERFGWWLREMELRFGYLYGGKNDASKASIVGTERQKECR